MKKSKADEPVTGEERVYELGFLFVPTIPEEKLGETYEALKKDLVNRGASLISEEAPYLRSLAYEINKVFANKNNRFSDGYFGWIKFELGADKILDLKKSLGSDKNIIRHILTKTVKENTIYSKRSVKEAKQRERGGEEKIESGDVATATEVAVAPVGTLNI